MIAVDTNVLARFLTRDDPAQAAVADRVLEDGAFVSLTVLLETAWLLRSRYRMERAAVAAALRLILEVRTIDVADADLAGWAIDRAEAGADIAEMLHIVAARRHGRFATFDRAVANAAGDSPPVPIETLA